jgi:hypothetical protein
MCHSHTQLCRSQKVVDVVNSGAMTAVDHLNCEISVLLSLTATLAQLTKTQTASSANRRPRPHRSRTSISSRKTDHWQDFHGRGTSVRQISESGTFNDKSMECQEWTESERESESRAIVLLCFESTRIAAFNIVGPSPWIDR